METAISDTNGVSILCQFDGLTRPQTDHALDFLGIFFLTPPRPHSFTLSQQPLALSVEGTLPALGIALPSESRCLGKPFEVCRAPSTNNIS